MARLCIFCGEIPEGKNKEHVIPQWLIKATGDPSRQAVFETDFCLANGRKRQFAFDQFTFPACESCNSAHSVLEDKAKATLERIQRGDDVNGEQFSTFLDWLDKIRVGLWLGLQMLDKNPLEANPKFHIADRIGQYDRGVIIRRSTSSKSKINMMGINSPSFFIMPSAFSLVIDDLYITNISTAFLCSRRCGFPYITDQALAPDDAGNFVIHGEFKLGQERVMSPILRRGLPSDARAFFQPMFGDRLRSETNIYENAYVRNHSICFDRGIGNIFEQKSHRFVEHSSLDNFKAAPTGIFPDYQLFCSETISIYEWQNWLYENSPPVSPLYKDEAEAHKKVGRLLRKQNRDWIQHTRGIMKKMGIEVV
ncbi:hypothetical protein [Azotobacter chroococcum]|uniref:hypothetical protein n=1 Tax=Azotobacter chroococcum TaxID=353 RepID=UPI0012FE614B|nr:hypothetical protein [Azotobacter chroococcum]